MLANVRYTIKDSGITTLDEEMEKEYDMEENMLDNDIDIELILGKLQRKMTILLVNPYCASISRNGESSIIKRGLSFGNPPNVRITRGVT